MTTRRKLQSQPHFDELHNFRDVASTVNTVENANHIKPGLLFRSARLDETTLADREKLLNQYHIKTVIDLRSKTEHVNALQKYSENAARVDPATNVLSNEAAARPFKIPGLTYAEINLNGNGYERALFWKLGYFSLIKVLFLMLFGYRMQAVTIIAKELLQPRGLVGLGMDTLVYSGPEIMEIFDILADESSYPVLVHCTQGKDRTGFIVLLILLLCGVDVRAITADYIKSEAELEPYKQQRGNEVASIGLDESFSKCPSDLVPRIVEDIETTHGGIDAYLDKIGVDPSVLVTVRQKLGARKD